MSIQWQLMKKNTFEEVRKSGIVLIYYTHLLNITMKWRSLFMNLVSYGLLIGGIMLKRNFRDIFLYFDILPAKYFTSSESYFSSDSVRRWFNNIPFDNLFEKQIVLMKQVPRKTSHKRKNYFHPKNGHEKPKSYMSTNLAYRFRRLGNGLHTSQE